MTTAALATTALMCSATVAQTAAAPPLTVNASRAHVAEVQRENRVFVPAQSVFSQVGATVVYTAPRVVVRTTQGKVVASMRLGSHAATVNGRATTLPVAPFVRSGQVMVPLRLVGEAAGATVSYSAHPRGVSISPPATIAGAASSGAASSAGTAATAGAAAAGAAQANAGAANVAQANPASQSSDAAAAPAATNGGIPWWVWLLALLIVAAIVFAFLRRKKEPVIVTRGSVGRAEPIVTTSGTVGRDGPSVTTRSERR